MIVNIAVHTSRLRLSSVACLSSVAIWSRTSPLSRPVYNPETQNLCFAHYTECHLEAHPPDSNMDSRTLHI